MRRSCDMGESGVESFITINEQLSIKPRLFFPKLTASCDFSFFLRLECSTHTRYKDESIFPAPLPKCYVRGFKLRNMPIYSKDYHLQ